MKQIIRLIIFCLLLASVGYGQDFVFSSVNALQGLSDNQVRYIVQLPDGRMVFKTSGNINLYDGSKFRYIHQDPRHIMPLKNYNGFYRIYLTGDSLLYIKDRLQLMCLNLRSESYLPDLKNHFRKLGFKTKVEDLFVDSGGRIWLLTEGNLISGDHRKAILIQNNSGNLQDIASEDQYLYLFYNTGTVDCYDLKMGKKLSSIPAYPSSEQANFNRTSLVVKAKQGFYQLRNGKEGGFFHYNTKNGCWRKILQTPYALNTLIIDQQENAFISCANGLWTIDLKNGKRNYIPTLQQRDGTKVDTEISTLFKDKQGGLWLGTLNQGLLYHHPARYVFENIGKSLFNKKDSKDFVVQNFAEDSVGFIYIKTESDVYRFYPPNGGPLDIQKVPFSILSRKIGQQLAFHNSYPNRDQTCQLTDKRNWSWTGTSDGLKVFDPKTGIEKVYYTSEGLSNNFIHSILQDRRSNIWISTSYGITLANVDRRSGKISFTAFGADEGTLASEYTDQATFQDSRGILYFGGINGFSILNIDRLQKEQPIMKPLFTNLYLKGENITQGKKYDGRIILPTTPPFTRRVELDYHQNFLGFEFSTLNYQNPSQNHFRYQLSGIDQHWRESIGKRRDEKMVDNGLLHISYTNLPPGVYKLKVMASRDNQIWNGPIFELEIIIAAPWWKTTMAYILYLIGSLAFLGFILISYNRFTKRKILRLHREEVLLLRIRNLIEQQNILLADKESAQELTDLKPDAGKKQVYVQAESEFLQRAISQVERNLHIPDYSVAQLSQDLNMDRTGLYRKLVTLMDKSPTLFIRNIRLEKAANLILEGKHSISQIADLVGFSSASYLSKCFQERYNCRPSEYADKMKIQPD